MFCQESSVTKKAIVAACKAFWDTEVGVVCSLVHRPSNRLKVVIICSVLIIFGELGQLFAQYYDVSALRMYPLKDADPKLRLTLTQYTEGRY